MHFKTALTTLVLTLSGLTNAMPTSPNALNQRFDDSICNVCAAVGAPCVQKDGGWGCGTPPPNSLPKRSSAEDSIEARFDKSICQACVASGVPCVQKGDGWGCGKPPPGSLP